MPEVARELSAATGREIRFEPIGAEAYSAGMRAEGVPEPVIEWSATCFPRSWTGATPGLRMGCSVRSGVPRATFATMPAMPRRRGCGTLRTAPNSDVESPYEGDAGSCGVPFVVRSTWI